MKAPPILCQRPGCKVGDTGVCDLKHDPVELCPNYAKPENAETPSDAQASAPRIAAAARIASGDAMVWEDLEAFSRVHRIQTVSVIGEPKSGKTTLIAAIYASLCEGPIGDREFVGSRTLVGFAKRHHLALLNSGRDKPKTPRTSRDDPTSFFHLALRHKCSGSTSHLIISDRSGEAYQAARQDTSLVKELTELKLANRACFVLDAAKLTHPERHATYSRQFKQMIYALHDNGAFQNGAAIEVIATKIDTTNRPERAEKSAAILDEFERQITEELKAFGQGFGFHRVCALPKSHPTTGYLGLSETLERWTTPKPLPSVTQPAVRDAVRQIDRLLAKW